MFFVVVPSYAYHIDCTLDQIEYSASGMPYPKLPAFAQSLIETYNIVDLDDLIDGMDLTNEWGQENLDLHSEYDTDWWAWKNEQLRSHAPPNGLTLARVIERFVQKNVLWMQHSSAERKRKGQGIKYSPQKATRFRNVGAEDPRNREGRSGI